MPDSLGAPGDGQNANSWIVSEVVIVFFMALELNNLVGS
jgi:hypothetical protein